MNYLYNQFSRFAKRIGIDNYFYRKTGKMLRVLCYHGLWLEGAPHFGNELFMSPEKFESRLKRIHDLQMNVLPLSEAFAALHEGTLPARALAITIDDGWLNTFTHMIPALKRYDYSATIYVQTEKIEAGAPVTDVALRYALENTPLDVSRFPGLSRVLPGVPGNGPERSPRNRKDWIETLDRSFAAIPLGEHRHYLAQIYEALALDPDFITTRGTFDLGTPDNLIAARNAGFEIALHSHSHDLGDFSEERIGREITENRQSLSRILDRQPDTFRHFCWPSGRYSAQAVRFMKEQGISLATTCVPALASRSDDPLLMPRLLDGELISDALFGSILSGMHFWLKHLQGSGTERD